MSSCNKLHTNIDRMSSQK